MTLKEVEKYLVLKTVVGSKSFGLDTPESDTDISGIYILPNEYLYSLDKYIPQVSDENNNITYYELNRFLELAEKNNPNILEVLFTDEQDIIYKDPILNILFKYKHEFLTKKCKDSFGGYAISQIKKARGLNKKIVNPIDKKRKTVLDFCYILTPLGTKPLKDWLSTQRGSATKQQNYGVSKVNNARDVYYIYYNGDKDLGYKGIINNSETSNELRMSSIPKSEILKYYTLIYNKDGYTSYCKDYKEYWEWVEKRNQQRYRDNTDGGGKFDRKNMVHCLRLLDVGIEIGEEKGIILKRSDRDYLLSIKRGDSTYDKIMEKIESKKRKLDKVFNESNLPEEVNKNLVNDIILKIRGN